MIDYRQKIKELHEIDKEFFVIDETAKVAHIDLLFDSPADIFDTNHLSKMPIMSDDFIEWIGSAFKLVAPRYRIDLDVHFKDMQGYSPEQLQEIFFKNIDLEFRSKYHEGLKGDRIALGLTAVGVIFFILMILMNQLWKTESVWKDIFTYVSDITTTIAFWEAVTILLIDRPQERAYLRNLTERFAAINFSQAD